MVYMTTKLFTYGLLQVPRIQQQLFKRDVRQEKAQIPGFSISEKLVNEMYKTITPDCDAFVQGTILYLEDNELEITDRFEGVQAGLYKRIKTYDDIEVYIAGTEI
jgi:hypothetical protein